MKFNYQARTKSGEFQAGIVEASARESALTLLNNYGLYVTFLEEETSSPFYARRIKFLERITRKDLVLFSRQLAIMFRSKVPLVEALETLASQTRKIELKEKLLKIAEDVEGGTSFSGALKRHPNVFNMMYISMVKSGEAAGKLSESLEYLAEHLEREYDLLNKVRTAMVYPIFVIFFFLVVIVLMIVFVVPQLSMILKESGQELPFITSTLIDMSDFVRSKGWVIIVGLIIFIVFLLRYLRTPEGVKFFDRNSLKVPILGDLTKKICISRFAENLSTLVAGGLPISNALEITADVVGNDVYRMVILKTRDEVRKGEPISSILTRYPQIFPPVFTQMTLVGERTGTLDSSLMNVVSFYQKEVSRAIDGFLSLLEPMLIIFLGLMVAVFAIAFVLPLYSVGLGGA